MEMEKKISYNFYVFFFCFFSPPTHKEKLFSKYVMETWQNWAPPLK